MKPKQEKPERWSSRVASISFRFLNWVFEFTGTFLYHEVFKRNTLRPMKAIFHEPREELQRRPLRQRARTKSKESSYIQVALGLQSSILLNLHQHESTHSITQGGLLFTSVASCLQWPGTQTGHWSAAASFYSSLLFAFLAIVTGSQQLLLLPNDRHPDSDAGFGTATAIECMDRHDRDIKLDEKHHLQAVVNRLRDTRLHDTRYDGRPNPVLVFALQAPIMLLTLSVMAFLAGLSSVVFAPLAHRPAWGDNAKIAVLFSTAGFMCICISIGASFLVHGLFSLEISQTPWLIARLQAMQANSVPKV